MAHKQFSRRQKAVTLVPLALLSGAWTASLVGFGGGSAIAAANKTADGTLPDGTKVPSKAIQAPASIPVAGEIAPGVPKGSADSVVSSAPTSGIPSAALSAYQKAAQIINAADTSCNIPWQLIAGIGRVESDHGRYGGNVLTAKGFSTPGIYGIELNGKNGTQAVPDTDGGKLDHDPVFDRAVGPMQFIPSTWSVVQVDADGDGQRNPQDINDAALATAVYLCSGQENLGTRAGQEKAVMRYNHSQSYVDLVLRIMQAYQTGDYTAVPNDASGGSVYSLSSSTAMSQARSQAQSNAKAKAKAKKQHSSSNGASGGGSSTAPSNGSTAGTTPTASGGAATPGGSPATGGNGGSLPALPKVQVPKPPASAPPAVKKVVKTLNQLGETTGYCSRKLDFRSAVPGAMTACSNKVGGLTQAAADGLLSGKSSLQILQLLGIKPPVIGGGGGLL